ncbi:MAG TPA: slipin family protein [Herpetosiphon sp.]|uniref:Band 7 protein n=1 Tax=Herpetosiphon aurantiacus (strain ATCC 23779 / DSM 785 / 114-95) TaxID=316274 RepID=A9AV86_HERA2|nr:slipin family protein [Herpetosiphon sp.]ABX03164.1 band 7 protein [Herpetosiphon aurantiacus DSM 785]HBW50733.1 slipin family protein [Herpetosiphon sp.]
MGDDVLGLIILLLIIITITAIRFFPASIIYEHERGLLYKHGKFQRVLEPGKYRFLRNAYQISKIDVRPSSLSLSGQEMFSADLISVKLNLLANFQIDQPDRWTHSHISAQTVVYNELQVALREVIAGYTLDQLLADRSMIAPQILALVQPKANELGASIQTIQIKDFSLPAELKRAALQQAKVQRETAAALEQARGEQAVLRSLANAARMLERNPALMNLRVLQALDSNKSNTIVLHVHQSNNDQTIDSEFTQPEV